MGVGVSVGVGAGSNLSYVAGTPAPSPTPTPTPAPANSVAPAITGTRLVGSTLTSSTGTWTNTPTSYAYQWKLDGSAIGGATASTITAAWDMPMRSLTCEVIATNAGGSSAAAASAAATDILFPNGTLVSQIGDSIIQQQTVGFTSGAASAGTALSWTEGGELNWAYQVDPRFNHDTWPDVTDARGTTGFLRYCNGSNQGVSGESSAQVLARMADVTGKPAPIIVCNIGVNDNNGVNALTLAQSKANIIAIADACRTASKRLILGTPRPELRAAYVVDGAALWTWAQATFGAGTSYPEVVLWDCWTTMTADGPATQNFRDSDLHLGVYGTQATALGPTNNVPSDSLLGRVRTLIASGDIIATDLWARTSLGTNPSFTGTTGGIGTGFTGNTPASWTIVRTTGTFAAVASLEANADTGGQSLVLDITPAGAGNIDQWRMQLQSALSGAGATALQSKWCCFVVEVEHDGNVEAGSIYAELTCSDANYTGRGNYTTSGTTNTISRRHRGAVRHWIRTAPILMPATLTSVQTAIYGWVMSSQGSTPFRTKIRRARLIEYGNPKTAWGL